jgi:hypothetical protein
MSKSEKWEEEINRIKNYFCSENVDPPDRIHVQLNGQEITELCTKSVNFFIVNAGEL